MGRGWQGREPSRDGSGSAVPTERERCPGGIPAPAPRKETALPSPAAQNWVQITAQTEQTELQEQSRAAHPTAKQLWDKSPSSTQPELTSLLQPRENRELTTEQHREIQKHHSVAVGRAAGAVTSLTLRARLRNPKGSAQPCPTRCSQGQHRGTQRRVRVSRTPRNTQHRGETPRSAQNRGRAARTSGERSEQEQNPQHRDESTRTALAAGWAPCAAAAQQSWGWLWSHPWWAP